MPSKAKDGKPIYNSHDARVVSLDTLHRLCLVDDCYVSGTLNRMFEIHVELYLDCVEYHVVSAGDYGRICLKSGVGWNPAAGFEDDIDFIRDILYDHRGPNLYDPETELEEEREQALYNESKSELERLKRELEASNVNEQMVQTNKELVRATKDVMNATLIVAFFTASLFLNTFGTTVLQ